MQSILKRIRSARQSTKQGVAGIMLVLMSALLVDSQVPVVQFTADLALLVGFGLGFWATIVRTGVAMEMVFRRHDDH